VTVATDEPRVSRIDLHDGGVAAVIGRRAGRSARVPGEAAGDTVYGRG
jgi:hypothetical protein